MWIFLLLGFGKKPPNQRYAFCQTDARIKQNESFKNCGKPLTLYSTQLNFQHQLKYDSPKYIFFASSAVNLTANSRQSAASINFTQMPPQTCTTKRCRKYEQIYMNTWLRLFFFISASVADIAFGRRGKISTFSYTLITF